MSSMRRCLTAVIPICLMFIQSSNVFGADACFDLFNGPSRLALESKDKNLPVPSPLDKKNQTKFFHGVADAIQTRRSAIEKILLRVNNSAGVNLELEIVERLLRGEIAVELTHFKETPELENIAVYASTNVPLYTLIAHGVVGTALAQNVWFRTPEVTRQVYLDLFQELESALPGGTLSGLHLLHESRDVQYDNFNKMYVLGLNKKGTKRERHPAEMVVFTGSPETARRLIENNIAKIKSDAQKLGLGPFKQVFLGFGAGVNPVIVLPSAAQNMHQVVYWSLEPTRINNGQDCLAADLYAVHGSVIESYVKNLLAEIKKMKIADADDPEADITPLSMNKRFDNIQAYREKYAEFLVNPEAVMDEGKKLVGPHVFVFPMSMFKEVRLQEHFAPFFTVFRWDTNEDLKSIARDERLQERAMYAVLLGGNKADDVMDSARLVFRESRHGVLINQTLFGDVHPNMPFGGKGDAASTTVTIDHHGSGHVTFTTGHRPTLLSMEANLAFGEARTKHRPPLSSRAEFQSWLNGLLERSKGVPLSTDFANPKWANLVAPDFSYRPRGLSQIRGLIQQEGLHIVANSERVKTAEDLRNMTEMLGSDPILLSYSDEGQKEPKQVPGVVLHRTPVGLGPVLLNQIRGRSNPYLGWGHLTGLFEENKYLEYVLSEAVQPGVMAHTESFEALKVHGVLSSAWDAEKVKIGKLISHVARSRNSLNDGQRQVLMRRLTQVVEQMMFELRHWFPEGAFLKNFGEYATADYGAQITTFATPPRMISAEFLRRFEQALSQVGGRGLDYGSEAFHRAMMANDLETGTLFINRLLTGDGSLLAQSRVKIAKTEMGAPIEVRVDFLEGEAVFGKGRFSDEFLPDEIAQAQSVINKFFAQAPEPIRYLSGGADVAKLEDGSWVIIEFNFGGGSGTLSPNFFPVDNHHFISNLLGHPTGFLKRLNDVYRQGPGAQLRYLQSLRHVRPLVWKASFDEISVTEVVRYWRDLALQDWSRSPSAQNAETILSSLHTITAPWANQENIRNLLAGAEHYFRRVQNRERK